MSQGLPYPPTIDNIVEMLNANGLTFTKVRFRIKNLDGTYTELYIDGLTYSAHEEMLINMKARK